MVAEGLDPNGPAWSVVPLNHARSVAVGLPLIADFRRHLRRTAEELPLTGAAYRLEPAVADGDETAALARGCATCRGWCCRRGGSHAFLDARSLARMLAMNPTLDVEDLEARYVAHIGSTHLRGGCLFQGERGCRLPRSLRSDTCNTWLCDDLDAARQRWRAGATDPADHHFVPMPRMAGGAPSIGGH